MAKKIKRPIQFEYENFTWKINYLNVEHDDHGETFTDTKIINIYTKNRNEQVILDSICHEINHLLLENIVPLLLTSNGSPDDIEEHLVRLLTPRLHVLYSKNKELRNYVFQ